MLYHRLTTLSKKAKPEGTVNLPRTAIIDEIILYPKIKLNNSGSSATNITLEDLANMMKTIRVVSDGRNNHYALTGLQAYIMTYYRSRGKVPTPAKTYNVPTEETTLILPPIILDAGDIFAVGHQSVTLEVQVATGSKVATDVTLEDFEAGIVIKEVVGTTEDYKRVYGDNFERLAEVKCAGMATNVTQTAKPEQLAELPVGNLLMRSYVITKNDTGKLASGIIDTIELEQTVSGTTLFSMSFEYLKERNRLQYGIEPLEYVGVIDYGADVVPELIGLPAFSLARGDIVLKSANAIAGRVEIVNVEWVVVDPSKFMEAVGEL